MSTEAYIARNGPVVDAFTRAMHRSIAYASAHDDEVRAIIPTYSRVSAEVARQVRLPVFDAALSDDMLQAISDNLVRFGIAGRPVRPADLLR